MICFMVHIQNLHPEPSKQNLYIVTKTQQSANTNTKNPRRAFDDLCIYSILVGTDAYLASATATQHQHQHQHPHQHQHQHGHESEHKHDHKNNDNDSHNYDDNNNHRYPWPFMLKRRIRYRTIPRQYAVGSLGLGGPPFCA